MKIRTLIGVFLLTAGLSLMLTACELPAQKSTSKTTPTPQTAGAQRPAGKVLFEDDFTSLDKGWPRGENDQSLTDYFIDTYHIQVKVPNQYFWATPGKNFTNIAIDVDASISSEIGGDLGLICRYQNDQNFYFFSVANDGYYGIYKLSKGKLSLLGMNAMRFHQAIQIGNETNHLRAECMGSNLRFYVNGQLIGETTDRSFTSGDVGLIASSYTQGGVVAAFNNFFVTQPTQ